MKLISKILFVFLICVNYCFAQTGDPKLLVREGIELHNQKDYAGAIAKYKAALAIDPDYDPGNYQLAFSLNAMGKGLDGIPYLEKVFKSTSASTNLITGAYDLAGSIYDQQHQPQKAIASYQAGIKANPAYQPLRYNLGLAYFRNRQYAEAEQAAIGAINIDPKQASSMRLYALVCFHQNKRVPALLGLCEFLVLEPNTARSAEAYGNLQHILQGGVLKPEPGEVRPHAIEAGVNAPNQVIAKAIAPFSRRRYASAGDLLSAQLSAIFIALGTTPQEKYQFWHALADDFYKLSQTPNMPAFARLISLSTPESAKWAKTNVQQMSDLDGWLKNNQPDYK
ncbi:tetratricopeptide repeat protein [Mucilaginibacter boryungensis]|uniref:Tetratricopeptide repeat protein n=1 Tax=Mucilaginibacter boryungensis TaxID=768480 RepID=A0ABR9XMK3_9SPHI|nr:tetratricopeptide repeat protein [Mucilaginibacter boryungensis]MBE9668609.1 tetratricopeptide repeat protein [Mucilaginibacter boryungensis]